MTAASDSAGTRKPHTAGNRPLLGIALLVAGVGLFTVNDAVSKWLTPFYPVSQFIFVRGCFAVATVLVFVMCTGGLGQLRLNNWIGQVSRSASQAIGTLLVVATLGFLPLAIVSSLLFASPMIMAALSGPMLGERVGWRRWAAIILGFVGVIVIIQPGTDQFQLLMLVPLLGAFALSMRDLLSRSLSRTETPASILFMGVLGQMVVGVLAIPLAVGPVVGPWTAIETVHLMSMMGSGIVGGIGQFLVVQAFRVAEASLLAPFKYSALIWALLLGYVFWGDFPSLMALSGAGIVVASGLYMSSLRETKVK